LTEAGGKDMVGKEQSKRPYSFPSLMIHVAQSIESFVARRSSLSVIVGIIIREVRP
jgi:hypothetical protein